MCYGHHGMLLLILGCAPESGTYLLETTEWSTTCSLAGGPYEEPAEQYEVAVYVEADGGLWLDDVACAREGMAYTCESAPLEGPAGSDASFRVTRDWSGEWTDADTMSGEVAWQTTCLGDGCGAVTVELCDAAWTYSAVNVQGAE